MNNLVQELKEKHKREKQCLLATIKNDRRHRYEQRGTELWENCQEPEASSQDNKGVTTGIVIARPIFKDESVKVDEKPSVSFDVPDEGNC